NCPATLPRPRPLGSPTVAVLAGGRILPGSAATPPTDRRLRRQRSGTTATISSACSDRQQRAVRPAVSMVAAVMAPRARRPALRGHRGASPAREDASNWGVGYE